MQAGDVYAFGALLWEIAAGHRMYSGLGWVQAMAAITLRKTRPRTPARSCMPPGLESLSRLCMAPDPACRPTFEEVSITDESEHTIRTT